MLFFGCPNNQGNGCQRRHVCGKCEGKQNHENRHREHHDSLDRITPQNALHTTPNGAGASDENDQKRSPNIGGVEHRFQKADTPFGNAGQVPQGCKQNHKGGQQPHGSGQRAFAAEDLFPPINLLDNTTGIRYLNPSCRHSRFTA